MNKEKVKRFVKEHKREILLGAVCVGTGIYIGKNRALGADERALVNSFREFSGGKKNGILFDVTNGIMKESTKANVVIIDGHGTVGQIGDVVKAFYDDPENLNTKCNGFIVFTK